MSETAIRVENLSKKYDVMVGKCRHDTLRDEIYDTVRSVFRANGYSHLERQTFWALRDVSFEVKSGDIIGVIGRNGAGKSTLLKILSRITQPTSGFAEIRGRVSSLLEVGTGFHPELTGKENVYLNGAILGMKKAEIDQKFDEIVAFSEIGDFIDTPVKRYSSGMHVRLAFAVAAHLEPDILIVDEVLAVGDVAFQKKCVGKMDDVASSGRTVLFVSHNMSAVAQICKRIILLENGRVRVDGEASSVISTYLSSGAVARASWTNTGDGAGNDAELRFLSARILSMDSRQVPVIDFCEGFQTEIGYELFRAIRSLAIVYQVINSRGEVIWSAWDTDADGGRNNEAVRGPGRYLSTCRIPGRLLRPGRYVLSIGACAPERRLAVHTNLVSFDVSSVGFHFNTDRQGVITPLFEWKVAQVS